MAQTQESTFELLPLKSFQHCQKDTDIVCFQVPNTCPLCHQNTASTECRIPPYILPSRFTCSRLSPRSIVLKPTHGNFIRNYVETCNLHIGISDSDGCVFNFDERGLMRDAPWEDCLAVSLTSSCSIESWETALGALVHNQNNLWTKERYHESMWNCFDFVLYFIKCLSQFEKTLSPVASMSKAEFCDNFLSHTTKRAEQYIYLYRQVLSQGCVPVKKS